jgi:hypothetical protein
MHRLAKLGPSHLGVCGYDPSLVSSLKKVLSDEIILREDSLTSVDFRTKCCQVIQ